MESNKKTPEVTQMQYKKVDADFREIYANNAFLESSLWDMKLILGQLDQQLGPNTIVQHTSVTLPWATVKVLRYLLGIHLLAHEIQNGKVYIPPNVVAPFPDEIPKDILAQFPTKAREIHEAMKACYEEFASSNSLAPSRE